jgi:sugar transferase (PEP-CTERM/EpsH1 system associated)
MRILYLSLRECWPPNSGARLRDYHLARQLAGRAELTYFGMRAPNDEPSVPPPPSSGFADAQTITRERPYTPAKLARGLLGPHPVSVLNYWSSSMASAIDRTLRLERFDTVQLEGVHLVRYVPVIRAADPSTAIVADWHNIESELLQRYARNNSSLAKRLYAQRTAYLVERAESTLLTQCDRHTVVSDRERETLMHRAPAAVVETLPNGVDVRFFDQVAAPDGLEPKREILFVGSMDYHANIDAVQWMVREAWPLVRRRCPGLQLTIVGREPSLAVRALAAEDIQITGTVEDVRPYYQRALAVVVPLRVGSGTRLKILEAMAARVPVVSTPLGAEGLAVENAVNVLLAGTGDEFAGAISQLASTPDLRLRLVREGHRLVETLYDWTSLGSALYEIHGDASERRNALANHS